MKAFPEVLEFKVEEDRAGRTFGAAGHLGITSRRVCERCNTGWMRDLEVVAEPILLPIMRGHTVTLTEAKQLVVARWYLKTAMMLERRGISSSYFFTDKDRKAFSESLEVPSDSLLIFMARYVGPASVIARDWIVPLLIGADTDSPVPMDGYTATITVKQFAAQFFAFKWPENAVRSGRFRIPGAWNRATIQIWPIQRTKVWPPAEAFDDTIIDKFIERLYEAEAAPPTPS